MRLNTAQRSVLVYLRRVQGPAPLHNKMVIPRELSGIEWMEIEHAIDNLLRRQIISRQRPGYYAILINVH